MARMIGADVDQLRSLANNFTQSADQLEQTSSGMSKFITNAAFWRGNDAEQFRVQWRSQSNSSITAVVKSLRSAADALVRNADEQDQASAAGRGAANSATSKSGEAKPTLGPAESTSKLWTNVWDTGNASSGYRLQEVNCIDGKTRYIVYIAGTNPDNIGAAGQSGLANLGALNGQVDWTEVNKLRDLIPKDSEVMLVGYSQGGMDAQNIAAAKVLNVTQIVTFGSPTRGDVNVASVNMQAGGDPTPSAGVANLLSGNLLSPYSPTNIHNWHDNPNHLDYQAPVKVDNWYDSIAHHTAYDQVAESFDKSVTAQSGPYQQGASIQFFQGDVTKDIEIK